MGRFHHFALLFVIAPATIAQAQVPADNPLVGTWLVDRFVDRPEGGEAVHPFGEHPVGMFIFTADGHFSFNVMRGAREAAAETVPPDIAGTPNGYVSYFGTWRYDPDGPGWIAYVLGGNVPGYIGTKQTRRFTIAGKVMTIAARYTDNGRIVHAERVLHRVDP